MEPVVGASSLELAIHWRISRAWLNWGKRKGLGGWWDQGRAWPGIGKVGEEGEVEVALVSDELEESGEPSGGEGGENVERDGRRPVVASSVLRLYGRKDEGGESGGGEGIDILSHRTFNTWRTKIEVLNSSS